MQNNAGCTTSFASDWSSQSVWRTLPALPFVTLPVTTASCEKSFSKLTIVKNKLRSTTAQDRLENLMILSVENDITTKLNYESVIDNFASMGPRRMQLT